MLTVQVDAAVVHDGRRIGGKALAEDDVVRAHASGGRQKQQQGAHYPFIALGLVLYFRRRRGELYGDSIRQRGGPGDADRVVAQVVSPERGSGRWSWRSCPPAFWTRSHGRVSGIRQRGGPRRRGCSCRPGGPSGARWTSRWLRRVKLSSRQRCNKVPLGVVELDPKFGEHRSSALSPILFPDR